MICGIGERVALASGAKTGPSATVAAEEEEGILKIPEERHRALCWSKPLMLAFLLMQPNPEKNLKSAH